MKLRLLDMFSGIGGFSLGLERSGYFETVAFCEIEPFPRAVLKKHWPKVPQYDDVRTLTAERLVRDGIAVDAICGGFPCQDISTGGRGEGISGSRSGLFSHIVRLTREIRPLYIILENVSAILGRGLGRILGDLAEIGYDAEWHCIPSTALGYPHERDRWFAVAYSEGMRRREGERCSFEWGRLVWPWLHDSPSSWATAANDDKVRSEFLRIVDGIPDHVGQLAGYGNSIIPQIPEIIGRAIGEYEASL